MLILYSTPRSDLWQNNLFSMFSAFISRPRWSSRIQAGWLYHSTHCVWIRVRETDNVRVFVWHRHSCSDPACTSTMEPCWRSNRRLDWKRQRGKETMAVHVLYAHTLVYGNALGLPVALAGMMMMRCKSKSHYTSLWVLLSLPTDNCIGLRCYESDSPVPVPFFIVRVWYDLQAHWCEHFGLFMVSFCVTQGQTELRLRDSERKKREKKLMLIKREERRKGEKIKSPLWEYLLLLCSGFYSPSALKKANDEAAFTIKGMTGRARTAEWKEVKRNDISVTPSLI